MSTDYPDISFVNLLPASIANDPTILAAAQSLDNEIKAVGTLLNIPLIYSRLDDLEGDTLNLLAWQFDVDFWDINLSDGKKRNFIKESIAWHKKKGTRWAVRKALKNAGYYTEIITYQEAQKKVVAAGGLKLDGTWNLDGTKTLVSFSEVAKAAFMDHWTQFCIKLDLFSTDKSGWKDEVKFIVDVAKNKRSEPVWLYYFNLSVFKETGVSSYGCGYKSLNCQPSNCLKLDGSWKVGRDEEILKFDNTWSLGDGFKLGQVLQPPVAEKKISDCRLKNKGSGAGRISVFAGYPEGKSDIPWFSLSEKIRTLDGSWKVGSDLKLDGTWNLFPGVRLTAPRLGKYAAHKLTDNLKLGYKQPESGSWPQVRGGVYGSSGIN